ncbi:hypothetical protein ASD79_05785 [Caulobacter sp. Root655]|nr:hypothetical protein ASD79_05785 [Caulobacter sp. Root655]
MLLSCASFGAQAAPDPVTLTDADRKEFHEAMISNVMMRGLMEADPAGFKAFEDGLLSDLAAGKIDQNGARKRGYEFAVSARAKLMSAVNKAPDDEYLVFANAQLSAMKVLSRYNTRACYEFVESGGISDDTSSTLGPALSVEIEKIGVAQVAAARAGSTSPVDRQPATDKEAEAALQSFTDLGGDLYWLKSLNDKTTDTLTAEQRCDGAIKWVSALLAQPKATAARLLTDE